VSEEIHISAVAFREGDVWVVQGIEYDIAAHADDVSKLPHAFMRAVIENASISQHLGREPLAGIKPAPAHFRRMFDKAVTEVRAVKALEQPVDLPITGWDIRVAEHA
jgi:hypothetical protein